MATRNNYWVTGNETEDISRTTNRAMRDISDRLDAQEQIRGDAFVSEQVRQFVRGDTRPSVLGHHLFTTKNVVSTTITHFVDGYGNQSIDVYFGDSVTSIDFTSGNLRSNSGEEWTAVEDQYLHAVFDEDKEIWYCIGWDAVASDRWKFVEFSGDRTLQLTDAFKMLKSTGSAAQTATVPPMSDVPWVKGDQISFYQYGSGVLTVAAGSGVTINTPSSLAMNEQHGTMVIVMDDTNQWFAAGRMG